MKVLSSLLKISRKRFLGIIVGVSLISLLIPGEVVCQEEDTSQRPSLASPLAILNILPQLAPGTLSTTAQQQADRVLKEASKLWKEVLELEDEVSDLRDEVWEEFADEIEKSPPNAAAELSKLMDRVTDLEKEVTELRNKASGLKVQVQEVNWRGYKLAENIEEEESAKAKGATKQAPTSQEKPTKKSRLVDRISILTEEIEGARDRISELTDDAEDLQDEFSHVIKRGNVSKRKIAIRDMGNRLEKIKKEVSILVKTLDKLSQEAKALEEKLKDTTTMEREEAEDELENLLDVMRDLAYALEDLEDLEEGPEVEALKVVLRELIQATKNVTADLEEEIAEKIGMEEIPALKGVEHLTQEIKEVTRNVEQIVGELSE